MPLFGTKKVRRPVADIVAGLNQMVADLEEAQGMAAEEQTAGEATIRTLLTERKVLRREQAHAGAVCDNLRELLALDVDLDDEDDMDRALKGLGEDAPEATATDGEE